RAARHPRLGSRPARPRPELRRRRRARDAAVAPDLGRPRGRAAGRPVSRGLADVATRRRVWLRRPETPRAAAIPQARRADDEVRAARLFRARGPRERRGHDLHAAFGTRGGLGAALRALAPVADVAPRAMPARL